MISNFLFPLLATLVLVILEIFVMKRKNSPWYYVRFFCIMLSINLLIFMSKVEGGEIIPRYKMWALTKNERDRHIEQYRDHVKKGHYYFNEASESCFLIPIRTDADKAEELFRVAVLTTISLGDWKVIIGNLIVSLGNYGINVYQEYRKIETLLLESKYHFEMSVFHLDILMRDGRGP